MAGVTANTLPMPADEANTATEDVLPLLQKLITRFAELFRIHLQNHKQMIEKKVFSGAFKKLLKDLLKRKICAQQSKLAVIT